MNVNNNNNDDISTNIDSNKSIYTKRKTTQEIYDNYNNLLFNDDTRVISKMFKRIEYFLEMYKLTGDIVEFGVFKGAGLALFLKLKSIYEPNSNTKIIGFDLFSKLETLETLETRNKSLMNDVLSRTDDKSILIETIQTKLEGISEPHNFILVKGDASITSKQFADNNPGLRIKILYMDLDVDKPTFDVLINLWENIIIGGIIILDEYGFHCWDESKGVDRFLKTIKNKYTLENTMVVSPTMVIRKIDL
jgi:hypothetical protein